MLRAPAPQDSRHAAQLGDLNGRINSDSSLSSNGRGLSERRKLAQYLRIRPSRMWPGANGQQLPGRVLILND